MDINEYYNESLSKFLHTTQATRLEIERNLRFKEDSLEIIVRYLATTHEQVIRYFALLKCESPIEQLFFMSLTTVQNVLLQLQQIQTQQAIDVDGNQYRVDFLLTTNNGKQIVVECDGHSFHERTPEQAQRDKSRDRALTKAGYHVLRYTGSEIYNDPAKCVLDVAEIAKALNQQ